MVLFTHFHKPLTRTITNINNKNKLVIHFRVFGFPSNWTRGGAWDDGFCHIVRQHRTFYNGEVRSNG